MAFKLVLKHCGICDDVFLTNGHCPYCETSEGMRPVNSLRDEEIASLYERGLLNADDLANLKPRAPEIAS